MIVTNITNRDQAYVMAFYRISKGEDFFHQSLRGRYLPSDLAERFSVVSSKLADAGVFKRLPALGLLTIPSRQRYKLTEAGVELAKSLVSSSQDRR